MPFLPWAAVNVAPVTALTPSGDTSGVTDQANVAGLLAAGRNLISLAPGSFYFAKPVAVSTVGVTVEGAGTGSTTINIVAGFSDPGAVTPGTFLAPAAFQVGTGAGNNAGAFTLAQLTIAGPGLGGSTAASGLNNYGNSLLEVDHVQFSGINGWGIEGFAAASDGTKGIVRGMFTSLTFVSVAGAMHLNGQAHTINSQMSDIQLVGTNGTSTGPAANLDGIFLDSGSDMVATNVNTANSVSASTAAGLHLGSFSTAWIRGLDAGGASTTGCLISGTSTTVTVSKGAFFGGYVTAAVVQDTTSKVTFEGVDFTGAKTNGVTVSTTGSRVTFTGCRFGLGPSSNNGQGATGTQYDLNWTGTGTGRVTNCEFGSAIVTSGSVGVQSSVNITAGQAVSFSGNRFSGTSTAPSNQYTAAPAAVPAGIKPTNPTGTASTSLVMMGLGSTVKFTPAWTGNLLVTVNGFGNTATAAVAFSVGPRFGTGTAPVNGAAASGTVFGLPGAATSVPMTGPGIGLNADFSFTDVLQVTVGTPIWIDLAVLTSNAADTASVLDISVSITEV